VRGLGKSDFRLRVDGRDTPLETVAEERRRRERPLSVAFLLDVSRSMRDLERERFLLAAQALLDRLRPSDEMMIVSFSDDYQIRSDFTKDPKALRAALESIPRPDWGTDLYAALEEALDRLSERPGRRVVILYSDGQATVGKSSLTATPYSLDVLDQTRRQPIPLYWIVPHFQDATIVQRTPALRSLALGSGGRWILEREGIEKALVEVGEDLGSQYFASFYVDKNEHRRPYYQIDLEPRGTGLKVQAPQVVAGSGSLVRRLEEMLASNKAEERLAAAVQLPRYGYAKAYFPLVQRYRREKDAGVRDAVLAALLAVMRDEWNDTGERAEVARDAQRRRLERQIRNLEDPRALALLEMLR
jgi:VWFA-related protein